MALVLVVHMARPDLVLTIGLCIFGFAFAVISSLHFYLISGNAAATAVFCTMADARLIDNSRNFNSARRLGLSSTLLRPRSSIRSTSADEWIDLSAVTIRQCPDTAGRLKDWAQAFVRS